MANLPKYTLEKNEKKEIATTGGILRTAVGKNGGSVKIQKGNGRIQEERTYPESKDPIKSKG